MKTYYNNVENITVINTFDDTTPSIILASGYGAILPATNGRLTVELRNSAGQVIKREVIDYTARSGDTLTGLTRSVELCVQDDTANPKTRTQNTLDFTPASGQIVTVSLRLTEEFVTDVQNLIDTTHNTLRDSLDNNSIIYVNNAGQEVELALGANGQFLKSNGATSAPTFESPTVDINGLSLDNDPLDTDDMLVYFDGSANKKRNAKASNTQEGLLYTSTTSHTGAMTESDEAVTPASLAVIRATPNLGTATLIASADTQGTITDQNTYSTVHKRLTCEVAGTYNFKFEMAGTGFNSNPLYGRIFVNGNPVGTEQGKTSSDTSWSIYSENITVPQGATIEFKTRRTMFGGSGSSTGYYRNFRMYSGLMGTVVTLDS